MPSMEIESIKRMIHDKALEKARTNPIAFCRYVFDDNQGRPWEVAGFHVEIQEFLSGKREASDCDHAFQSKSGPADRKTIHAPIKHGKTEQIAVSRVLWELGRNPDLRVCICSNTFDLAEKIGHALRTHIQFNERLHEVFPALTPGARWREHGFDIGGRRRAGGKDYSVTITGIFGPVLGSRFDLLVFDDPNNAQNTSTSEMREKVHNWVKDVLMGRLDIGGRAWAIGTAWNTDDLLFRFVDDGWSHVLYRATSEGNAEGVPLWPERAPLSYLKELREPRNLGTLGYARQCDNDPKVRGTGLLQRAWFVGAADNPRIIDSIPLNIQDRIRFVRFWDLAATDKNGSNKNPCYTAGVKLGLWDGLWYLADVRRKQVGPEGVEDMVARAAIEDGRECPIVIEQEPGSASTHLEYQFKRRVLVGFNVRMERPHGNKVARAGPIASAASGGLFRLIRGQWNSAFLDEAEGFPNGAFKDQIDALSGAMEHLSTHGGGPIQVVQSTIFAR